MTKKIFILVAFSFFLFSQTAQAQDVAAPIAPETPVAEKAEVLPWLKEAEEQKTSEQEKKKKEPVLLAAIEYSANQSEVSSAQVEKIDAIAQKMEEKSEMRINIKSYAGKRDGSLTEARRFSLKRALSIRQYIVNKNIESTRIVVQALGDKFEGETKELVEIFEIF